MKIDRTIVIQKLKERLESIKDVNALWLEGADSLDTVDEFSDIDIWVDVNDGKENETIEVIKGTLSELGELDFYHETEHPHPKIRQFFFHIEGTSKFLIIDLCIQSNSREFWFTEGMNGEKSKTIFDKKNVITIKPIDETKFNQELSDRRSYLLKEYQIKKVDTEKEIARNDYLGALNFYISLNSIFTELMRIKYCPTKHEFGLKHAKRDFPKDIRPSIESIYQFKSIDDIKANIKIMDATEK
ncbi:MAG: hypothetical protein WCK26_01755 [Candidatus Saccharibacteria bacterium]